MDITLQDIEFVNLSKINILLGKNGCGKSRTLRRIEENSSSLGEFQYIRYISPERAGDIDNPATVENAINSDPSWLPSRRRQNFAFEFRKESVAQYRTLELNVLRRRDKEAEDAVRKQKPFSDYIDDLNSILDHVEAKAHSERTISVHTKEGEKEEIRFLDLSSGEREMISLGMECIVYSVLANGDKQSLLLLDEPDVHIHPDLQERFVRFMERLIEESNLIVIMATHSTALVGALSSSSQATIGFMTSETKRVEFESISEQYHEVLPIFGAHPLSNLFNQVPPLLVEGEDDVRIWQQAVRSSNGHLKLYPCECGGLPFMSDIEDKVAGIISAVYDDPKAFSLRDRDDNEEHIDDKGPIVRMRLSCRSAENLLLSDDVLKMLNCSWDVLTDEISKWIESNESHSQHKNMANFAAQKFPRKEYDLKDLRNLLMAIIGSSKPWEVAVGQTIGTIESSRLDPLTENSIADYLGTKLIRNLLL